jgi:hypothetical protein
MNTSQTGCCPHVLQARWWHTKGNCGSFVSCILLLLAAALAPFGVGVLLACASGFPPRGPVLAGEILAVAALYLAALAGREAYAPQAGRWSGWDWLTSEAWRRRPASA